MSPVRCEFRYTLPAAPEVVWPLLANTELLNRRLGLPPTEATPLAGEPVRTARIRARLHGILLEWIEEPFELVEPRYYWVERQMTAGPIRAFNGGARFTPCQEGTDLLVQAELVPANAMGRLVAEAMVLKTRGEWDRLAAEVTRQLTAGTTPAYGAGVDRAAPAERQHTERTLADERFREFRGAPLAEKLCEYLAVAGGPELNRIRPFALAREWGADRYDVLKACLRAVPAGILDLSWDLMCPNCGGAKSRWASLELVEGNGHCEDCQIRFDATFDRSVEVTFRPNPTVRPLDERIYCSGGPRNTPHVVAQVVLAPGASRTLDVPLHAGRYRLRNLTGELSAWLEVAPDHAGGPLTATLEADGLRLEPADGVLQPGDVPVSLLNRTGSRQQVILERPDRFQDAATAAVVSVYQEFRNLFTKELLSPTAQLGIGSLALMFTDLKGSTALYAELGDVSAYSLVRDHFQLLQDLVGRHGGGVVKTVGDAVMAAFPTPADAIRCALRIHADLEGFNRTATHPVRLKVGVHHGPCIAVRSYDDRLDYFGGTVNLAARTHEQSRGDDIVVSRSLWEAAEVAELVAGVPSEPFVVDLRGLGEQQLVRLFPPASRP